MQHRVILVVASLFVLLPLAAEPAAAAPQASAERRLAELIDEARLAEGLRPLVHTDDLHDPARAWSVQQSERRQMAHNSRHESTCCWQSIRQNVGTTALSRDELPEDAARRIYDGFIDSPGHRANILHPHADQVGVGIEIRDGRMWVTVDFRQWNGDVPEGGFRDPYTGETVPARATRPVRSGEAVLPAFDGDGRTSERTGRGHPVQAAIELSRHRFAAGGARHVVLSRSDLFADALAGTPLSADGPMLFTGSGSLDADTRQEIRRVLPANSTVYVLGGPGALSDRVISALSADGYWVARLAGQTRVETALRVAEVVHDRWRRGTALLARADDGGGDPTLGWADSIAGGALAAARRIPILITHGARLDDGVDRWLDGKNIGKTVLLGGPSALSRDVERRVPGPLRLAGAERAETARAVAEQGWGSFGRRRYTVVPGWSRDGWAYGLAAAGLSAKAGAPILLVGPRADVPGATLGAVTSCEAGTVDLLGVGPLAEITDETMARLDRRDGHC